MPGALLRQGPIDRPHAQHTLSRLDGPHLIQDLRESLSPDDNHHQERNRESSLELAETARDPQGYTNLTLNTDQLLI